MDSKEMGERSHKKQKAKLGKAYAAEMRRRAMIRWQSKKIDQAKIAEEPKSE